MSYFGDRDGIILRLMKQFGVEDATVDMDDPTEKQEFLSMTEDRGLLHLKAEPRKYRVTVELTAQQYIHSVLNNNELHISPISLTNGVGPGDYLRIVALSKD